MFWNASTIFIFFKFIILLIEIWNKKYTCCKHVFVIVKWHKPVYCEEPVSFWVCFIFISLFQHSENMLLSTTPIGVVVTVLFIESTEFDRRRDFSSGDATRRMCELYVFISSSKLNLSGKSGYGCSKNSSFFSFGLRFFEVFPDLAVVVCSEVEWRLPSSGRKKWGFGIGSLKTGLGFSWKNGL